MIESPHNDVWDPQMTETVDAVVDSGRFTFPANAVGGCFLRTKYSSGPQHPHKQLAKGYFRGRIDVVKMDSVDQSVGPHLVKDF